MHIQVSPELTLEALETDWLRSLDVEPRQEHFGVGIASAFSLDQPLCRPSKQVRNINVWKFEYVKTCYENIMKYH